MREGWTEKITWDPNTEIFGNYTQEMQLKSARNFLKPRLLKQVVPASDLLLKVVWARLLVILRVSSSLFQSSWLEVFHFIRMIKYSLKSGLKVDLSHLRTWVNIWWGFKTFCNNKQTKRNLLVSNIFSFATYVLISWRSIKLGPQKDYIYFSRYSQKILWMDFTFSCVLWACGSSCKNHKI